MLYVGLDSYSDYRIVEKWSGAWPCLLIWSTHQHRPTGAVVAVTRSIWRQFKKAQMLLHIIPVLVIKTYIYCTANRNCS